MSGGIARRGLVFAIRGYRRWVSGRGPLRRVRCTFDHGDGGESCSAFGLRAAHEAPSARAALARIQRRLRRCGATSLYALDAPDGTRALGWGADHDRPLAELHDELVADGEGAHARAQVLSAREVAARWRGDLVDVAAVRALRASSGELPAIRPALRALPPLAALGRALVWRAAAAMLAIAAVAAIVSPLAAAVVATPALVAIASIASRHLARRARLERQARSALLREPDQLIASLPNRCMVAAISAPRLHSTMPKPSM